MLGKYAYRTFPTALTFCDCIATSRPSIVATNTIPVRPPSTERPETDHLCGLSRWSCTRSHDGSLAAAPVWKKGRLANGNPQAIPGSPTIPLWISYSTKRHARKANLSCFQRHSPPTSLIFALRQKSRTAHQKLLENYLELLYARVQACCTEHFRKHSCCLARRLYAPSAS